MSHFSRSPLQRLLACVGMPMALSLALAASSTSLYAQAGGSDTAGEQAKQSTNDELLRDFVHYVFIDRPDLAAAFGKALLDKQLPAGEFAALVDNSRDGVRRFNQAVINGQKRAELADVASDLLRLYEDGKRSVARNAENVAKNIADLTGSQRQRQFARERLASAGEYAMPQLLDALLQREDLALSAEARRLMVEMSRQSMIPLCVALPEVDPASQELIAGILGDIQYSTAVPFLYDLRASSQNDLVRSAAEDSIRKIVGVVTDQTPLSDRYLTVAEEYYAESPSLTSFAGEPNQLWWGFNPGTGLFFQAVDTSVFHEAMAMRLSERALKLDGQSQRALSLWLASNFSREIDSPEAYVNPAYGAERREAMYYAVAAGPSANQRVLARALDTTDTPLARKAIAAIEKTAGGAGLWAGGERRALLEALRYPNRRVQYESSLAIGNAQPREAFDGSERVVPILASAIRDAAARTALVIAAGDDGSERQASIAAALRQAGFIITTGSSLSEVAQAINDVAAIDLLVSDLPQESTERLIDEARTQTKLKATPVLAMVSSGAFPELTAKYGRDQSVQLTRPGLNAGEIGAAAEQLLEASAGGAISAEEAQVYQRRALNTLRDLAIGNNPVLSVADASAPLVTALAAAKGDLRPRIAEVLALVPTKSAQVALVESAIAASGGERITLLLKAAESAKRQGNQLDQRHIDDLVLLASSSEQGEATTAAALLGALSVPNKDLVPLILGEKK